MTAGELQEAATDASEVTLLAEGLAEQARLRGLTAQAETFGLPACDTHLIAKLRAMPEEQRNSILVPTTTRHLQLPKERP
jgi:hypothetical protein